MLLLNPFITGFALRGLGLKAAPSQAVAPERTVDLSLVVLTGLPFMAYLVLHALHDRVQGHWPTPLYPALAVAAAVAATRPATSAFGAFLDPVADKFLVCASLLVLVHLQRADVFVALIIIGREIAISALREWMAQIGASRSVAVHVLGKLKTTVQMVAIPFLLFDGMLFGVIDTALWGLVLIWIAGVLTVWSMVYYLQKAWPDILQHAK